MFSKIKQQLRDKFDSISKNQTRLFSVTIDRDKIYEIYLDGFIDPTEKQEHTCNCCKSFLRQYGALVAIIDNKMVSLWDIDPDEIDELYRPSITGLSKYIHSLPITNVFFSESAGCGTDKNADKVKNVIWEHFHLKMDNKFVHNSRTSSIEAKQGDLRANHDVLKRSLDELTDEACTSVLELIAQGSIYRGTEFKHIVEQFYNLKKEYNKLKAADKDAFVWIKSTQIADNVAKIRNVSIGTLLVDISDGMDLDAAVTRFEKVVAPSNYKRPTAIVTQKMIDEARTAINELGYATSLERRYARPDDLTADNLIFIDKSTGLKDIFDELGGAVTVDPKTLKKLEEMKIEDFIKNVVPTSKKIEVLLENSHINKMVTLLTASDKDSKSIFKWDNPFSWSYTGGITDTMKERVKAAGGNVSGVLRFSIQWNEDGKSVCDLDAHATEPDRHEIYFGNARVVSALSGVLDVDIRRPNGVAVENIVWSNLSRMKPGVYKMQINNFDSGMNTGFTAQIEFNGEIFDFAYNKKLMGKITVAEVTLGKDGVFTIKNNLDGTSKSISKDVWGLKTNQFVKVKQMFLSPNFWNGVVGNKHYMFALEGCESDESPRPFFNEFLNDELMSNANKRMFEVLGSKIKIEDSKPQVSGLGFSDTQRNSMIVRVTGTFARNLKINF